VNKQKLKRLKVKMNDPTKRINVEKSSLFESGVVAKTGGILKNKKKVPLVVKSKLKNSAKTNVDFKKQSGTKVIECEGSSLIAKSQKILEAKAKYYRIKARYTEKKTFSINYFCSCIGMKFLIKFYKPTRMLCNVFLT
jgi:uncharacterized protein YcfL